MSDNIRTINSLRFTRTGGDDDPMTLDGHPRVSVQCLPHFDGTVEWWGLVDGKVVIRTAWAKLSGYRAAQKIGALK